MDSETDPQQDATERPALSDRDPSPARWFQRVLPVTGIVVALIAIAAVAVPAFRDQVELSVSRKSQSYVELYFAKAANSSAQAVCSRTKKGVQVRFVVASHLDKRESVAYRVAVEPAGRGARTMRKAGVARVTPGTSFEVAKSFAVPRRQGYTVSVRLLALDQQLRAHCSGRTS